MTEASYVHQAKRACVLLLVAFLLGVFIPSYAFAADVTEKGATSNGEAAVAKESAALGGSSTNDKADVIPGQQKAAEKDDAKAAALSAQAVSEEKVETAQPTARRFSANENDPETAPIKSLFQSFTVTDHGANNDYPKQEAWKYYRVDIPAAGTYSVSLKNKEVPGYHSDLSTPWAQGYTKDDLLTWTLSVNDKNNKPIECMMDNKPVEYAMSIKAAKTSQAICTFEVSYAGPIYLEVNRLTSEPLVTSNKTCEIKVYKTGVVKVGNSRYCVNADGTYKTGLVTDGGKRYYFDPKTSAAVTGLRTVSGKRYYFSTTTNAALKGLQKIGNSRYYFDPSTSAAVKGWKTISGKRYYFSATTNAALKGLQTIGGKKYYFSTTTNAAVKGLQKISGKRYYFNPSNWAAYKGWKTISGKRYYFKSNYQAASGWNTIGKNRYHFNASTNAATKGWKELGGKWYYFNSSTSAAAKGWATIGGARYRFDSSCRMLTGWQKVGNKWYYFNSSGAMQKAKWIGSYYVKSNGVMATNTWIGRYHVNAKGVWDKTR